MVTRLKSADCKQLLKLRCDDSHELQHHWLQRKIIAWTSVELQEEIVAMTAHKLVQSFSAEVRDKKSFVVGLLADEMADISRIEKLNICRRTVTLTADSFEVQEKLFGFYAMHRCDGKSLDTFLSHHGQSQLSGHRRERLPCYDIRRSITNN